MHVVKSLIEQSVQRVREVVSLNLRCHKFSLIYMLPTRLSCQDTPNLSEHQAYFWLKG